MNPTFLHRLVLCLSLLLFAFHSNAQTPVNDECSNAIEISPDSGPLSVSNSNTLVNGPEPGCGGTGIEDIWFYFIHPGGNVSIQTTLGTNTDTRIAVYHGCGQAPVACNDDNGGYMSLLVVGCPEFNLGDTCYLQAGGYNAIDGTFTINITSAQVLGCTDTEALNYNACATLDDGTCENAVTPENDICANAFEILIGAPAILTNNTLATPSASNPSCGNQGSNLMLDLWYFFVHDGTEIDITVPAGTLTDTRLVVYDGCGGVQVGCDDDSGLGNSALLHFACGDLIQGHTYYLRVGGYGSLTGNFYVQVTTTNSCELGASCDVPYGATVGENIAPQPNTWFAFTPPNNGQWRISTCNLNSCDTKLWLYDYCNMANFDETNAATFTYNDDFCGSQAEITPMLAGGFTYYLRVGDHDLACESDTLYFLIEYMGPVVGCMDIDACNYNPVAEVEDTCYYNGDPNCDGLGPDLTIEGGVLYNSLFSTTITSSDACLVNEGCLQGIGTRQILRFTTHIKNIGNQDYYIGSPGANPSQFEWDECHNHYHYEGYAEYLLFDQEGNPMPQIGFKNGFCVLDLECSGGGIAKFGCGNMGITAGCGDIYSSGLACQWIDITDVPDGDYFLVVRTNWDQSPDNAGHYEQRYDNNVAQVCIHFERDTDGNLINFTKDINNCLPVTDCLDIPFGDNHPDCAGNCPGVVKRGEITGDQILNEEDVHHYVESTIDLSVPSSACTDLNNDGVISVADAVMLEACIHGQEEQGIPVEEIGDCPYDDEIINPNHTTELGVYAVSTTESYVDVYALNPDKEIKGLEFEVSGFTISSVELLQDLDAWDTEMAFEANGTHVSIIGHDPTFMPKFSVATPIIRLHYAEITSELACISEIIDAINLDNHNTLTVIGSCQELIIPLQASFTSDQTTICQNDAVIFTNNSFGSIQTYEWEFPGGNPSSAVGETVSVMYTEAGSYNASLTVSDGINSSTILLENYITVLPAQIWYSDEDMDGYGNSDISVNTCNAPVGFVSTSGDCDDNDSSVYPDAPPLGNNVDTDCSGSIEPDETQIPVECACDINGDGQASIDDMLALISGFGCSNCPGDLDNDGVIGSSDIIVFMGCFGVPCE